MGARRRGKTGKNEKVEVKEKLLGVTSVSLFPARKREAVTQSGAMGIDNLM